MAGATKVSAGQSPEQLPESPHCLNASGVLVNMVKKASLCLTLSIVPGSKDVAVEQSARSSAPDKEFPTRESSGAAWH